MPYTFYQKLFMFLGVIIEDDKIKLSEVTGNKMECAEKFEEYNFVQWARFYYNNVRINPTP